MVLITSCSFVEYQLRKAGETGFDLTVLYFECDLSWNTWSSLAQCANEIHTLSSVTIHINSPHPCFVVGTWLSKDAKKRFPVCQLSASLPYSLLGGAKEGPCFAFLSWLDVLVWGPRSERKIAILISTLFLSRCCYLSPFWISLVLPWQKMSQNGKWNMQKT